MKKPKRANGGNARAAKLSNERKKEIASKAANVRWQRWRERDLEKKPCSVCGKK